MITLIYLILAYNRILLYHTIPQCPIPRNYDCEEEEDAPENHEDAVREFATLLEKDIQREGVGGYLGGAVQQKVDHDGAAQVAWVEGEAVVHEGVGEPVEVEDQRLLGHVGGPEKGQEVRRLRVRGFH